MQPLVITLNGKKVRFTWAVPANNGDDITDITVLIFDPTALSNEYTEDTTICDAGAAYTGSINYCEAEMADVISTFNYVAGQTIKAKVYATNSIDDGLLSLDPSDTIFAQTAPTVHPSNVALTSTSTTVSVTFDDITTASERGYSPITQYHIYIHDGSDFVDSH